MMTSARWAQPRLRSLMLALAALALVGVGARAAHAGDGAQFAGDCGGNTYVNKKVGDTEQWAITWDGFSEASGNVFKLDGSAASFIECFSDDGVDGTNVTFTACYGSSACSGPQCGGSQWVQIGTNLTIPVSFFYPPGVDLDDPEAACDPSPEFDG